VVINASNIEELAKSRNAVAAGTGTMWHVGTRQPAGARPAELRLAVARLPAGLSRNVVIGGLAGVALLAGALHLSRTSRNDDVNQPVPGSWAERVVLSRSMQAKQSNHR
jgi:hypothetical protein